MLHGPGVVLFGCRLKFEATGPTFDQVVDPVFNTAKTTVAINGAGDYTVTLPKVGGGWPQELIALIPALAVNDAADAGAEEMWKVGYVKDSYNKDTGTFQILTFKTTGSTSTAAANVNDEAELHFVLLLRYDRAGAQTIA